MSIGPINRDPGSASKRGSGAISMRFNRRSRCADQSCLKEVNLCSAVHLPLDQFELGDLAFCLAVRPRLDQASMDGGDARGEGGDQALACAAIQGTRSASVLFRTIV
jgi:hypothetical protein